MNSMLNSPPFHLPKEFYDYAEPFQVEREDILYSLIYQSRARDYKAVATPVIENANILLGNKYTDETLNSIYCVRKNKDSTQHCLRYEHTRPLIRYVNINSNSITFPFFSYRHGLVFRREEVGNNEFLQFDIDLVEEEKRIEDKKIILDLFEILQSVFPHNLKIHLSHAGFFDMLMGKLGIHDSDTIKSTLDNFNPLIHEIEELKDTLRVNGLNNYQSEIIQCLVMTGEYKQKLEIIKNLGLTSFFQKLNRVASIRPDSFFIDYSIVRGNGYYTGIIFEAFCYKHPNIGALAAGGRYDTLSTRMKGKLLHCIGASIGVDRICKVRLDT